MPTLLAVNNYYYRRGGAETVFFEHNRLLEDLGWHVVPFAMKHPMNFHSDWSQYFVDEIEFGANYSLRERMKRVSRVIYSLQATRNLSALLGAVRPDVCHAHNIYHHISPSILHTLRGHRIPVVMTLHDLKIACPAYNMLAHDGVCERCRGGRLYNVALHRCIKKSVALSSIIMVEAVLHALLGSYRDCVDRFVVPSRFYLQKLVEWGFPATLFRHVPNFVDVDRYVPRYSPGANVIYVGRLSREKGLHTLVRAAAEADCSLEIAGTGPEMASIEQLAQHLSADVRLLGYLSGAQLHDAIRRARAVVLPSECYENAPMSVLEAYALGKPIVGARIGGIPELVRDGETGYQFHSGDVADLARVLRQIVDARDTDLAEMGRLGRQWTENEFSAHRYADRIQAVYGELGISTGVSQPLVTGRSH